MAAQGKPQKGTTPGTRFRAVAERRRKDMDALLEKKRFDAAVYLGGYAIECYLKYLITRSQNIPKLPADFETHVLNDLAAAAFTLDEWDSITRTNKAFERIIDEWGPSMRYQANAIPAAKAKEFCTLIDLVYNQMKELKP